MSVVRSNKVNRCSNPSVAHSTRKSSCNQGSCPVVYEAIQGSQIDMACGDDQVVVADEESGAEGVGIIRRQRDCDLNNVRVGDQRFHIRCAGADGQKKTKQQQTILHIFPFFLVLFFKSDIANLVLYELHGVTAGLSPRAGGWPYMPTPPLVAAPFAVTGTKLMSGAVEYGQSRLNFGDVLIWLKALFPFSVRFHFPSGACSTSCAPIFMVVLNTALMLLRKFAALVVTPSRFRTSAMSDVLSGPEVVSRSRIAHLTEMREYFWEAALVNTGALVPYSSLERLAMVLFCSLSLAWPSFTCAWVKSLVWQ